MIKDINTYLAFRRAAGFELHNDEYLLHSYARFADASSETFIRTSTAIQWASQSVSVAQRDVRLKTLCRFARYICLEDKRHELPPAGHFAYRKTRRLPYIYSDEELTSLIKTALLLGPPNSLRPYTYASLIALLSATGLRISEALRLQFSDITPDGLLINNTKFRKSRLVPLHDSVVLGLERYLIRRQSLLSVSKEVFITDEGQKLSYPAVHYTFKKLLKSAKILSPSGVAQPRLHDFRHRFAVNSLLHSSPDSKSVSQHMRRWRRTWATSMSIQLFGILRLRRSYYAILLLRVKNYFSRGINYDTNNPAHRRIYLQLSRSTTGPQSTYH